MDEEGPANIQAVLEKKREMLKKWKREKDKLSR